MIGLDGMHEERHFARSQARECATHAIVNVTLLVDNATTSTGNEVLDVVKLGTRLALAPVDFNGDLVLEHTRSVAERPEHQGGLAFVGLDHGFLDFLVDGRLDGAHEAGAHVDAFGAQGNGGSETAAVAHAARGDVRDLEGLGGLGEEDEAGNVVLTGVTGALVAVDREDVDAETLGGESVADGGALVDDDAAGFLEALDKRAGVVAGGLDDLDARLDDGGGVLVIGRGVDRGQDGEVDTERLGGHLAAAGDLFAESVGSGLGEGGDDAAATGVGDGSGHVSGSDPLHAALDDGVFDAEHLGELGPERHFCSTETTEGRRRPEGRLLKSGRQSRVREMEVQRCEELRCEE